MHNADCTIKFSNKAGLDEDEFKQQLSDQQDGLNDLTVDEYLQNCKDYEANGRSADSAKYQEQARKNAIAAKVDEYVSQGMKRSEAKSQAEMWAKGQAALHGSDQIAGGKPDNIIGLGNSKI